MRLVCNHCSTTPLRFPNILLFLLTSLLPPNHAPQPLTLKANWRWICVFMCWCFIRNLRNRIDIVSVLSGYWSFVRISSKHPGFFHRHNNGSKYQIIKPLWTSAYFLAYLRPCRFPQKKGPESGKAPEHPERLNITSPPQEGESWLKKTPAVRKMLNYQSSYIFCTVRSNIPVWKPCAFAITLLYKTLLFTVFISSHEVGNIKAIVTLGHQQ